MAQSSRFRNDTTYPTSYASAVAIGKRKLGHNTYLMDNGNGSWSVTLHTTKIATFHRDGRRVYDTGGWNTSTTRDRINACLPMAWGVGNTDGCLELHRRAEFRSCPWDVWEVTGNSFTLYPEGQDGAPLVRGHEVRRVVEGVLLRDPKTKEPVLFSVSHDGMLGAYRASVGHLSQSYPFAFPHEVEDWKGCRDGAREIEAKKNITVRTRRRSTVMDAALDVRREYAEKMAADGAEVTL